MTDDYYSLADHQAYRKRTLHEIRRLRAERDEWKDRWEAERADHEATIRHTNKMLADEEAQWTWGGSA